ncbi:WD repeat-containing protein 74 [Heterocephalus glaber]|uniref:WD repeat-containing protein 74 n=1 Tax=Heterocephalus glaber TaxID=10181 RepID=G5AYJ5_HETGA|nr:WD repeat-containing protein 74 isoform X2 [Heterocephalus glaber]EHB02106.1 WD repeat-containing protein 74 [Heterocephalus glaber]
MAVSSACCNHVWVGTETGILKGVDFQRKLASNFTTTGQPQREAAVNVLCWGAGDETQILVGCADLMVRRFSTEEGAFQCQRHCPGGEGTFRGLAQANDTLITCVDSGVLRVWHGDDKEAPSDPLLELKVGPGVCRMRQDPAQPHLVATGGKENALKVWDLQGSEEPVFRAKNVRNDWLDLRVPIWDQDVQFVPGSQKLITCTGYHQVRMYDPASSQRRPVLETTFGEYPLTAMTLTPGGNSVIVGNTHGQLAEIDFRQGRLLGCLKGLAGSVRGLQCHPTKPLLASCGLDRVLRIHRIQNPRGLEHKVYLKSRLNCLLLSGRANWRDELEEPRKHSEEPPENTEVDELWASLEVAAKRKLPRVDQGLRALEAQKRKKRWPAALSPQPCE